jgi:RNA ligase (TIGR02306 family)
MSKLKVEVVKIKEILKHPNADRLEIAKVLGWEVVVQKNILKNGDICVFVPIDAMLPVELSDKLGVTNYLSRGRVRTAKLRGVYSQGLIMSDVPSGFELGDDVKEIFGITKYVPPPPPAHLSGKQRSQHPDFHRYIDIENIKNFPDVLQEGELVSITEKIHGTNFRSGMLRDQRLDFDMDFELHVGTHNTNLVENPDNTYWKCANMYKLNEILDHNMVIYGEVYGSGVQKLTYGLKSQDVAFFDLMVNGKYINTDDFKAFCKKHNLPQVPILYEGPWDVALVNLANGSSTIASHIREGIVIKPKIERYNSQVGRVAIKHLSEKYLLKDYGDLK